MTMTAPVRTILFVISAFFGGVLAPLSSAALLPVEPEVRWYELEMAGSRVGSVRSEVRRGGPDDANWVTETVTSMSIRRGRLTLEFELSVLFEETEGGEPVRAVYRNDLGGGVQEQAYVFGVMKGDAVGVRAVERSWGAGADPERDPPSSERERFEPMPGGEWLTPLEVREFVAKRLAAGAAEITYRSIDPSSGLTPVTLTRSEIEADEIEIDGRPVRVYRCVARSSTMPAAPGRDVLDETGDAIESSFRLGAIAVSSRLTSRAALDAPAGELPELMVSTFVRPDTAIEGPRATRAAAFRLRIAGDGEVPEGFSLPVTGFQTVRTEAVDDGTMTWIVRQDLSGVPEAAEVDDAHRVSSSAVTSDDSAVIALAESVGGDAAADPAGVTEALRRLVHWHVSSKALSVGFATAAQVARSREGDCTEHAVLLAAVLRARGIPSRVVTGLVYADQFAGAKEVFAYHMWSQAALPDGEGVLRWVDVDATLPRRRSDAGGGFGAGYDAAHIAIGVSALSDGEPMGGMLEVASVLGLLEIDVLEVSHDER